jgi:hypothetical protein
MKNGVFWDVSVLQLLVTADIVLSSAILVTLMMEGIRYSKTSVLTRATQRNIPVDGILHSHCCKILKSYTVSHVLNAITK